METNRQKNNRREKIAVKHYRRITSTQNYAENMKKNGRNLIVTAKEQTAGKGTKGRAFSSQKGGVYLSALFFYNNLPADKAFLIMASTCAAVCKTLEEGGIKACVKWPNDVFAGGKKICGILTENTFSQNGVQSVCGIGLNVNNVLPAELNDLATTAALQKGKRQNVKRWRARLIRSLCEAYAALSAAGDFEQERREKVYADVFDEYRSRLGFIGENVALVTEGGSCIARISGVDETGRLLVLVGGEKKAFSAGEVVRLRV
ncbi:MAG: biotin--[acetyl-CoA-carboxylase] ligase [Candidatus Borkfalkiaceae bacterium]|nr:biotin--[acetyl-CoA-carboxylase] ligase [Clostridia bacterium]MDY6223773.1 biotin--[acetyl-CoA-carboxylase] ligase [Christensenellaceae bacterium]